MGCYPYWLVCQWNPIIKYIMKFPQSFCQTNLNLEYDAFQKKTDKILLKGKAIPPYAYQALLH